MTYQDPSDMDDEEYQEYLREEKTKDHLSAHNPLLEDWLARLKDAFPAWAGQHKARGPWDFTVDSLPRLEALFRDTFPSTEDARANIDEPRLAVAAWYLGEVHNRTFHAQWQFHPSFADSNPHNFRPHVTLPWDRRDDFYRTDPEHIEDDARPIYSPTDVLCRLPNTPLENGLMWRIGEQWEPGGCDDEYCRYHAN
ncbi:hypothetical protein ACIRPT_24390 [Streptomyces sp. NPDC101227]|uniref:hypothetical protein n=1 Tax=Streptomyces sp. NPDC101227 TaxID=3366136 RepID=UPI003816D666